MGFPPMFTPEQYVLLPDEIVQRDDLPVLIDRATKALLDRYTETVGDGPVVRLRGYDPDPAKCDPDLLTRLRYAIADVVEHGVNLADPNVSMAVRGSRTVVFRKAIQSMPRSAFRLLDEFDLREPLWRV